MLNRTEKLNPILAIALIISLTLYYFIFVANNAITYAIDVVKTNNHNVDFSAYFVNENGEKVDNISQNIDLEEYLYVDIEVKDEGYFDGEIEIQNGNFVISEEILSSNISKISENKVTLKQINSGHKVTIKLALKAIKKEIIEISNLKQKSNIVLTGKYLNSRNIEKQDNIDITGMTYVELNWVSSENIEANLNAKVLTNYIYQENKIFQILVESNITSNNYPIKNTEINVTVPENVKSVKVHSRENNATNSNVIFDEKNYTYDKDKNLLIINVGNEDEKLISWNKNTIDAFVVTYEFEKDAIIDDNIIINSIITTYDNKTLNATKTISSGENIDGIISFKVENKEEYIYKGKMYTGEEREYTETVTVNVDYTDTVNEIKIDANESKYNIQNKEEIANIFYKEIKINKNNFMNMLGNTGFIAFRTEDGDEITKITNDLQEDENGDIVVTFSEVNKNLLIITSRPITTGKIKFITTKKILNSEYQRDIINEINSIETNYIGSYNNKDLYTEKKQIDLKNTETTAKLTVSDKILYEEDNSKKIKITATLLNNNESQDLYKNPKINILLPNELNINSAKCKLLYGNGLKIESASLNNENEENSIKINLSGEQTNYNTEIVEGTKIVVYADVTVKNINQDLEDKIIMNYSNDYSISYKDNGNQEKIIKLMADANEENIDNRSNEKIKNLKSSLKAYVGGEEIEEGDKVYAGEIITYELNLENIGEKAIENLEIEATIPENTTLMELNPNYPKYDEENGSYTKGEDYFIEKTNASQIIKIDTNKTETIKYLLKVNTDINQQMNSNFEISIKDNNIVLQKMRSKNVLFTPATMEIVAVPTYRPANEDLNVGKGYKYSIKVKNLTKNNLLNVKMQLQNNYLIDINDVYYSFEEDDDDYDEGRVNIKDSTFEIESIPANKTLDILVSFSVNPIKNNDKIAKFIIKADDNQSNIYRSNYITENVIGEQLELEINSQTIPKREDSVVCVGDSIKYTIKAKNVGENDLEQVKVEDQFSNYLNFESITLDGETCEYVQIPQEEQEYEYININMPLKAGEEKTIEIMSSVKEIYNNSTNIINKAAIYAEDVKIDETSEIIYKAINESEIREEKIDENNPAADNNSENSKDKENNTEDNKFSISGIAWLDVNENGARDEDEKLLEEVEVKALNINNNEIKETKTLSNGKYSINNLEKGSYIVIFDYDKSKYYLTTYKADGVDLTLNSDVEFADIKINGNIENIAATDTLIIEDMNQENIDIGLIEAKNFDLCLTKTISKVTINNSEGIKVNEYNDTTLAKTEIKSKYLGGSLITIEYKIKVKNDGEVAGYAKKIVDYKATDLSFNSNLNKDWYQSGNNLYSESLKDILIKPGETKELTLILTKNMTSSNTGLTNNTAEIVEDLSINGEKDIDSIPENKEVKEDDIGSSNIIISVSTGAAISYVLTTMLIIISIGFGVYIMSKKIL